jgi:thiol:disulfide interchange protein
MASVRFGLMTVLLWLFASIAPQAFAQDIGKGPHVRIELVAESDAPAPGSEVTLAFVSTPEPEWHGYWQNPGDAGIGTTLKWTLPAGVEAGALQFPVPERLLIAGLMNYVYEKPFTQLVTLKLPAGLTPGTALPVRVTMDYLVCTLKICVPEKAELAINLRVGDGAISADKRARFDQYRSAIPKPLGSEATYQVEGDRFRLGVPWPAEAAASDVYFFPITDGAVDYAAPQQAARDGDRLVVETKAKGSPGPIEGVLAVGEHRGFVVRAVPGTVAPAKTAAAAATGDFWVTALLAFGGAVLGGLLLNIMPCVFPILSLKALSLAKANEEGSGPRAEALAYTAGVVLVCLALGGLLLALRAGGASLGWAFQLQDPRVILVLLLLVLGIALNLAGLFELSTPRVAGKLAASGKGGAFMTGALAAFVATPCAGPFMASALGAALVLPWPAALAVFGGLGLGIALPFLLLGFIPALRRRLPRPGPWMDWFRKILSIPMFLTAIALAWVLGRQTGVDGMAWGLLIALALGIVLWGLGRRQARGLGSGLAWIVAALITVAGVWLISRVPPPDAETKAAEFGEPFSEARLAELRAQGRPVFAYFTADWCLTCKVNEKGVIETDAVRKALADGKVAVLVGDWTNGDAALGRFIERHNRAGVPLYLWYKPGEDAPRVLPQILTQGEMVALAGGG